MRVEATTDVPAHLRNEIPILNARIDWGYPPEQRPLVWLNQSHWVAYVEAGGHLATHVGILEHTVLVDGRPLRVGGVTSVMTAPELERRGYGTAALRRAAEFIRSELRVPFALLACFAHRVTLYEGLGWRILSNRVYCDQPDGKILLTEVPGCAVMALLFAGDAVPVGDIDLQSSPW